MSYIRPCKKCGRPISLREMPHGQWVAFEKSAQIQHDCSKKKSPRKKKKFKKTAGARSKKETIYSSGFQANPDIQGIKNTVKNAAANQYQIQMDYEKPGSPTSRIVDIYGCDNTYFWGYCHLRAEKRTFRIDRVRNIRVINERFLPRKDSSLYTPFSRPNLQNTNLTHRTHFKLEKVLEILGYLIVIGFILWVVFS